MCWSASASVAIAGLGAAATVLAVRRGQPLPVALALGYFTLMEGLQAAGYLVLDDCGGGLNRGITLLSYLHIAFQPVVINILLLSLLPQTARRRLTGWVMAACGLSVAVMLWQIAPGSGLAPCLPGSVLCGAQYCTIGGTWHLGWTVPYHDLPWPFPGPPALGHGFPTYTLTVFVLPVLYGAWRFVLFHAAAGPWLAQALSGHPNEWPAVWCLFSLGIVLAVVFPRLRALFAVRDWPLWPAVWRPAA